jgi:hypothetical protein
MEDAEDQAHLFSQIQQQAQKRHRVSASGHGDANAVSSFQESVMLVVNQHLLRKSWHTRDVNATRSLSTC